MVGISEDNVPEIKVTDFAIFGKLDYTKHNFVELAPLFESKVGNIGAIKLSINANDHEPPHLHVMVNNRKLPRLNLNDYTFMDVIPKDFSRNDQRSVVSWAKDHNKDGNLIKQFRKVTESVVYYYFGDEKMYLTSNYGLLME